MKNDHSRPASPLSQFTGENIQLFPQLISNDPYSTYDEIIAETSLSLYNGRNYPRLPQDEKATSLWVPHQRTHQKRVKLCCENFSKFQSGS